MEASSPRAGRDGFQAPADPQLAAGAIVPLQSAAFRSTALRLFARRKHAERLTPREHEELRFSAADGEWRVVFAFDTKRKAILLVAGDKSGVSEKRFYRRLIRKADDRFEAHLARLKKEGKQSWL